MKIKNTLFFTLFLLLLAILSSCDDCTFTSKNATNVLLRFYTLDTPNNRRWLPLKVEFDSIRTLAQQGRAIYNKKITSDTFYLPLNPSRDSSFFVFYRKVIRKNAQNKDTIINLKDTIGVSYFRQISIVTPDCGYDQRIENVQVMKISPLSAPFEPAKTFLGKTFLTINDTTANVRVLF